MSVSLAIPNPCHMLSARPSKPIDMLATISATDPIKTCFPFEPSKSKAMVSPPIATPALPMDSHETFSNSISANVSIIIETAIMPIAIAPSRASLELPSTSTKSPSMPIISIDLNMSSHCTKRMNISAAVNAINPSDKNITDLPASFSPLNPPPTILPIRPSTKTNMPNTAITPIAISKSFGCTKRINMSEPVKNNSPSPISLSACEPCFIVFACLENIDITPKIIIMEGMIMSRPGPPIAIASVASIR